MNIEKLLDGLIEQVKAAIARSEQTLRGEFEAKLKAALEAVPAGRDGKSVEAADLEPLIAERVAGALRSLPAPRDGKDGRDGTSISLDAVQALVRAEVTASVATIPKPIDGKDGAPGRDGMDGAKGDKGEPGERGAPGKDGERGPEGPRGAEGPQGREGPKGEDAPIIDMTALYTEMQVEVSKAVSKIPAPRDGAPGKDGVDGRSVTTDDVEAVIRRHFDGWVLAFERDAQRRIDAFIQAIPVPRDGRDGSPGRAGLGLEDFELAAEQIDPRTYELTFEAGGRKKSFRLNFPVPLDAGPWRSGEEYRRGDCVSFANSLWIAQKDTEARPSASADWRLAVRKGKDALQ